jgi:hypothetical protein
MELGVRILIRVVFLAQGSVCALDILFGGMFVYSKKLGRVSIVNHEENCNKTLSGYILCKNPLSQLQAAICTVVRTKLKGATCLRRQRCASKGKSSA